MSEDAVTEITREVMKGLPKLPGEVELLEFMKGIWLYGAKFVQLEACWVPPDGSESLAQLLEVLIGYGDVSEINGIYYPAFDGWVKPHLDSEDLEILRVAETHEAGCECATCMSAYRLMHYPCSHLR